MTTLPLSCLIIWIPMSVVSGLKNTNAVRSKCLLAKKSKTLCALTHCHLLKQLDIHLDLPVTLFHLFPFQNTRLHFSADACRCILLYPRQRSLKLVQSRYKMLDKSLYWLLINYLWQPLSKLGHTGVLEFRETQLSLELTRQVWSFYDWFTHTCNLWMEYLYVCYHKLTHKKNIWLKYSKCIVRRWLM